MTFSWHGGREMPSLIVPDTETNDDDEEQEHTDAALVKHDIIKVISSSLLTLQCVMGTDHYLFSYW